MSSAAIRQRGKQRGRRPQRKTSNVFAMFDQNQIQEFKQAFDMIDTNKDQMITKEDLQEIFASLGKDHPDSFLDDMLSQAPGPINFTMFLTMFGEKLNGTDSEEVIKSAFQCFDDEGSGKIEEAQLREMLMSMGDRFTKEQCDVLFKDAPTDENGLLNYGEFTKILKHGTKDKDDK